MSKQVFNRNEPTVIKAAMDSPIAEDFVNLYKDITTATEKTLTQAYYDIKYDKKTAIIKMKSGAAKNTEPIDSIPSLKTNTMAKKDKLTTETTTHPARYETHDGVGVHVPVGTPPDAETSTKEKPAKKKSEPKPEKVKSEKSKTGPTKQDKIKELLKAGKTPKEIKVELVAQGLKVYDSEILNAKNKLND